MGWARKDDAPKVVALERWNLSFYTLALCLEVHMPFGLQPIHLAVVIIVALVIFGPKRLPQLGRWIGRTFTEFRKGAREMSDGFKEETGGSECVRPAKSDISPGSTTAYSDAAVGPFCTKCGASNPRDARYCNKCGSPLSV
jgi:sec-independent protein translocase protein TatA